jgi:hypothetical protein
VLKRLRSGWSAEGNPLFGWQLLVAGAAVLVEERSEFDADSGLTSVTATATVPYVGEDVVRETIVVRASDGLELTMDRIDQELDLP